MLNKMVATNITEAMGAVQNVVDLVSSYMLATSPPGMADVECMVHCGHDPNGKQVLRVQVTIPAEARLASIDAKMIALKEGQTTEEAYQQIVREMDEDDA